MPIERPQLARRGQPAATEASVVSDDRQCPAKVAASPRYSRVT